MLQTRFLHSCFSHRNRSNQSCFMRVLPAFHQRLTQAHDHHARRPHHSYNGTQPVTAPRKRKSTPTRPQHPEKVTQWQFELPLQGKTEHFGKLNTFLKRSPSRIRPPHPMRVCNHSPVTSRSHRHQRTHRERERDRHKLCDATGHHSSTLQAR